MMSKVRELGYFLQGMNLSMQLSQFDYANIDNKALPGRCNKGGCTFLFGLSFHFRSNMAPSRCDVQAPQCAKEQWSAQSGLRLLSYILVYSFLPYCCVALGPKSASATDSCSCQNRQLLLRSTRYIWRNSSASATSHSSACHNHSSKTVSFICQSLIVRD